MQKLLHLKLNRLNDKLIRWSNNCIRNNTVFTQPSTLWRWSRDSSLNLTSWNTINEREWFIRRNSLLLKWIIHNCFLRFFNIRIKLKCRTTFNQLACLNNRFTLNIIQSMIIKLKKVATNFTNKIYNVPINYRNNNHRTATSLTMLYPTKIKPNARKI